MLIISLFLAEDFFFTQLPNFYPKMPLPTPSLAPSLRPLGTAGLARLRTRWVVTGLDGGGGEGTQGPGEISFLHILMKEEQMLHVLS